MICYHILVLKTMNGLNPYFPLFRELSVGVRQIGRAEIYFRESLC